MSMNVREECSMKEYMFYLNINERRRRIAGKRTDGTRMRLLAVAAAVSSDTDAASQPSRKKCVVMVRRMFAGTKMYSFRCAQIFTIYFWFAGGR